jgi:tetratricopeptide (TPR) repeat protein
MSIRLVTNCTKQKETSTKKHETLRKKRIRVDSCNFAASFSGYFPITLLILVFLHVLPTTAAAQTNSPRSPLDSDAWGVVLDIPATRRVAVKPDVTYFTSPAGAQAIDIYSPTGVKKDARLPAVIFLNAIGDRPGDKVKRWEIYKTWPRLIAAHGMIGISMDADGERIQDSLRALFDFLEKNGASYGVDPGRLGVYAASANVTQSAIYLLGENAHKGIKAAAFFYGAAPDPAAALRKDLPVLFITAEGDINGGIGRSVGPLWQKVIEQRAPWTIAFASRMPHAFDAFEDNDESRRYVMQAIAFWKTNLEPVPAPPWKPSEARAIVSSTYTDDYQRTAGLLTKYTAENPNDARAFILLGRNLQQLRRFDEAGDAFERGLSLDAENLFAHGGLGQVRIGQRRWAEAITHLSKAIDGGFRNSLMYGQLAWAQLNLNQNAESVRSYENAFNAGIPPGAATRGAAYYNMACAYARLGRADKAFESLNKAVDEGYNTRASYETDGDLAPLRSDAKFAELLKRLPPRPAQ